MLYLAVEERAYLRIFCEEIGQKAMEAIPMNLLVGRIEHLGEAPKTAEDFTDSHPKPMKYVPFEAKFDALYPNDRRLP